MPTVDMDGAIQFLNELLDLDQDAITELALNRVQCNEAMAEHPTAQVVAAGDGGYRIGLIGVLNGLFAEGSHRIAARFRDGKVIGFERYRYPDDPPVSCVLPRTPAQSSRP